MHRRIVSTDEIVDVLSEDQAGIDAPNLADCLDITYVAINTGNLGVIFWDETQKGAYLIQAFLSTPNGTVTAYRARSLTGKDQSSLYFDEVHDWLMGVLGTIHQRHAKFVRDRTSALPTSVQPKNDEVCTNIADLKPCLDKVTASYLREISRGKLFVVAGIIYPLETSEEIRYTGNNIPARIYIINDSQAQAATKLRQVQDQLYQL